MDALRSYLLSDKNFNMLEDLIPQKIQKITGVVINSKDQFFQQQMMMITTSVVRDEISHIKIFDRSAILKINNIIITECVNHFLNLIKQENDTEQEFSSKLDEIESDEEEIIEPFEEPKEVKPLVKENTEEILIFDQMVTTANLKNIVSAELVSCYLDFSDYIVNEKNNKFCIDNQELEIPIGNYTPDELMSTLNAVSNNTAHFSINKHTDIVNIHQNITNQKKSMTGSIKEGLNQKTVNIDFGVRDSISSLLGFSKKTYIVKDTTLESEIKHNIKHPACIDVVISFDDVKQEYKIPCNIEYNQTLYYVPDIRKMSFFSGGDISQVSINISSNTRGRPFSFSIKFSSL